MSFDSRKAFPLLTQVMEQLASPNTAGGLCFHRAAALTLDLPYGDLCIGTLDGARTPEQKADTRNSPTPFLHAWVEQGTVLYAPTLIEAAGNQLLAIPRAYYYSENNVRDVRRANRRAIKKLAEQHGWLRNNPFGERRGDTATVGRVLLDALGVAYEISDRGGVVPPEVAA